MEIENVYQVSGWVRSPTEIGFMEEHMIKGGIRYGIAKVRVEYALIREAAQGIESVTLEIDEWHKPFKKRKNLNDYLSANLIRVPISSLSLIFEKFF